MDWKLAVLYLAEKQAERDENKLFLRWAVGYQTEMTFDDFVNELRPSNNITDEDAIAMSMDIISKFNNGGD